MLSLVWSGAAVFAGSLLWFLYAYLVRFGRPVPDGSSAVPVTVDVLLFTAFAFHHSLFARPGLKQWMRRAVSPHLERSVYTWVSSLLFIAVCVWWQPVPGVLFELQGVWRVAGYLVQAAGIGITLRAASALDVLDLAGVRGAVRSDSHASTDDHVPLETNGLYGLVRHPLYLGWALFVFGTPVMTGTRALFAAVSTAYLAMAIPWEERSLIQTFGPDYEAYQRKVRWRMIPGIY
jgi:protein-S-isoprenylcysteine O-methyltransferase Ste14